jgi:hypothetical protein
VSAVVRRRAYPIRDPARTNEFRFPSGCGCPVALRLFATRDRIDRPGPPVSSVRAYWDRGHGGADAISSTSLDIVLAVIAAVAAAVAVWRSILAGQQAREAKKARELSAVISLFNAHQSEDHSHIRRLIRHGTIADHLDDQEIRVQLRHYINELNFIATLRARQLLDDELVKDMFYEPARACWEQCAKTFVREIRATQNDDFARELQQWIGAPDP